MSVSTSKPVTITKLAGILGRRITTVVRWRDAGKLNPIGLRGSRHYYDIEHGREVAAMHPSNGYRDLKALCPVGHLTIPETAKQFHAVESLVHKWFNHGILTGVVIKRGKKTTKFVSKASIESRLAARLARRPSLKSIKKQQTETGELRAVCPIKLLQTGGSLLSPLDRKELERRREKFRSQSTRKLAA